jgi:hypothetical protein
MNALLVRSTVERFEPNTIEKLLDHMIIKFQQESSLARISAGIRLTIVGDLHGQFFDLIEILHMVNYFSISLNKV